MSIAIDVITQEAATEAAKKAAKETSIKTACKLLDKGISKEVIIECTGLTKEEVEELMLQTV